MGTSSCCSAHLAAMVRDLAPNAENGVITVKPAENRRFERFIPGSEGGWVCKYCDAPAEFEVSYYTKERE